MPDIDRWRQLNDGAHESEEDKQRRELGPRGVPGAPDPAKMTPQRKKKTSDSNDPPHTA